VPCPQVYDVCDEVYLRLHRFRRQQRLYTRWARLLDIQPPDPATLQFCEVELRRVKVGSREPLHQRSLYGRNLLDLRHQQDRVRLRLLQCDETKMLLNRLLIANFCLFFNYESQEFQLYSRDLSVQEVGF